MCRVYAMQALNWLLRCVTQPVCLHDLLWWFVTSLTPADSDVDGEDEPKVVKKGDDQVIRIFLYKKPSLTSTYFLGSKCFGTSPFRRKHSWRCCLSITKYISCFIANNSRFNDIITDGIFFTTNCSSLLGHTI